MSEGANDPHDPDPTAAATGSTASGGPDAPRAGSKRWGAGCLLGASLAVAFGIDLVQGWIGLGSTLGSACFDTVEHCGGDPNYSAHMVLPFAAWLILAAVILFRRVTR